MLSRFPYFPSLRSPYFYVGPLENISPNVLVVGSVNNLYLSTDNQGWDEKWALYLGLETILIYSGKYESCFFMKLLDGFQRSIDGARVTPLYTNSQARCSLVTRAVINPGAHIFPRSAGGKYEPSRPVNNSHLKTEIQGWV